MGLIRGRGSGLECHDRCIVSASVKHLLLLIVVVVIVVVVMREASGIFKQVRRGIDGLVEGEEGRKGRFDLDVVWVPKDAAAAVGTLGNVGG